MNKAQTLAMAQVWKEQRDGHWSKHFDFHGYQGLPPVDVSPDPKLVPVHTYSVRVCGFTSRFGSVAQIVPVLDYYQQQIPLGTRQNLKGRAFEHDVSQRWFERLPGHLRKESNRHEVVKALELALEQFAEYHNKFPTTEMNAGGLPIVENK